MVPRKRCRQAVRARSHTRFTTAQLRLRPKSKYKIGFQPDPGRNRPKNHDVRTLGGGGDKKAIKSVRICFKKNKNASIVTKAMPDRPLRQLIRARLRTRPCKKYDFLCFLTGLGRPPDGPPGLSVGLPGAFRRPPGPKTNQSKKT